MFFVLFILTIAIGLANIAIAKAAKDSEVRMFTGLIGLVLIILGIIGVYSEFNISILSL